MHCTAFFKVMHINMYACVCINIQCVCICVCMHKRACLCMCAYTYTSYIRIYTFKTVYIYLLRYTFSHGFVMITVIAFSGLVWVENTGRVQRAQVFCQWKLLLRCLEPQTGHVPAHLEATPGLYENKSLKELKHSFFFYISACCFQVVGRKWNFEASAVQ